MGAEGGSVEGGEEQIGDGSGQRESQEALDPPGGRDLDEKVTGQ